VNIESGDVIEKSEVFVDSTDDAEYLVELKPEMIRASTDSEFMRFHGLQRFADSAHFAASREPREGSYKVLKIVPFDIKAIKKLLLAEGVTWDAIKTSGVEVDPRDFELKTGNKGPRLRVGIIFRQGKSIRVAITDKLKA
jgi:hypothetical protein